MQIAICLGIIQLFLFICVIIYEYRIGSVSIFLWLMNTFMIGIGYFRAIFVDAKYESIVYEKTSLFGIFFIIMYMITRVLQRNKKNVIKKLRILISKDTKDKSIGIIQKLFFLYFLIFILFLKSYFGSILTVSWGKIATLEVNPYNVTSLLSFGFIYIKYVMIFAPGIICIYLYKKNYIRAICWSAMILIPTLITRNRSDCIPIIVSILIYLLIKNKKITSKVLIKCIVIGIISVLFIDLLRIYRFYGTLDNFITTFDLNNFLYQYNKLKTSNDGEISLIDGFFYFVSKNGNFKGFNSLATYRRLLLICVPTKFSFGLKPFDFAITMGSAYINQPNNTTYSMHPTLFGDCYANFNNFGILLGIFWAFFVKSIDKICSYKNNLQNLYMSIIFGYAYIIIGRGSVYNGVINSIYSIIILWIVYQINNIKNKKRSVK